MTAEPAARPIPTLKRERQTAQYRRALQTLPGGTNSNFRVWGDDTVYIDRGKGGRVWDQDGNEYIDLRLGYGPGDPRPRRRAGRRPRQRADAHGRQLLAHERGRDPGDGAPQGAQPVGRQGADDRVGHRGDDARDAGGPGLHRPHEDREVRGPVPRRPRLRAHQRGAQRHEPAGRRGQPRRASPGAAGSRRRSRRRSSPRATTTSTSCAGCSSARARRSPRSSWSRCSGTPPGSCPSRASTRRCARSPRSSGSC